MVSITKAIVDSSPMPVTVKTRLGWDDTSKNIVEVAERLQDIGIKALTIHGRTRVQMYKGSADWSLIGAVKNNPRITIPIFGNGDIDTPEKALDFKNRYGVDGIMIGRASIGYPWIFNEIKHYLKFGNKISAPDIEERIKVCRDHLNFSIRWKGERTGIVEMRRHYSNYFKGLDHFKDFRTTLVTSYSLQEIYQTLENISNTYSVSNIDI
jgi:nifR3 family TIM-barrel protein